MNAYVRFFVAVVAMVGLVTAGLPAGAQMMPAQSRNMNMVFAQQNATGAINSDLAFFGDLAFAGNYAGFRIFDISDPANATLVSEVACDGPQNDVSVWDRDGDGEADILFLSVDAVMTGPQCGAARAPADDLQNEDNWEGIRIFDVSDPAAPVELDPVYQHCGSHTHTLVPDPDNNRVFLYNSSYPLRPGPSCGPDNPAGRDPLHRVIQVVEVAWDASDPLDNSQLEAETIAEPGIAYDDEPFVAQERGLIGPFDPLVACHDIGVFMPRMLAAGACAQEAQLWRIDPDTLIPDTENPLWVFDDPVDENGATGDPNDPEIAVDFWHSATFSWDGKVVNFSDESFAGFDASGPPACPPQSRRMEFNEDEEEWEQVGDADTGRTHFFDVDTGRRLSHFMINRPEEDTYCSTHQGNVVRMPGRNLLVQAWYQGGVNIVDFTSPRNPREVAFLRLLPHEPDHPMGSDNWSHYWYERDPRPGSPLVTFGNDGHDAHGFGFQVFESTVGRGRRIGLDHLNPQTQEVMRR